MKNLILIFCSCLISIGAKGQWYKLPTLPTPFCFHSSYNGNFYPLADGKIFYTAYCSGNASGSTIEFKMSYDDLASSQTVYSNNYMSCCAIGDIDAYNDSSIAIYTSSFGSANSSPYYTQHNFQTISSYLYLRPSNAIIHESRLSVTNNFIYSVYQRFFTSSDTLLIYKSLKTPNSYTVSEIHGYNYFGTQIDFVNDSLGFILSKSKSNSNKYSLFKTIDYAQNWNVSLTDSVNKIKDFCFINDTLGYMICENGLLYKTINSGVSWSTLNTIGSSSLNCIGFSNTDVGYVGGSSGLLKKTIDGGQTWSIEISNTNNGITQFYCYDPIIYFKDSGDLLYKNSSPISVKEIELENKEISVFPNPTCSELHIAIKNFKAKDFKIIDAYGRTLKNMSWLSEIINLSDLESGYYYVLIETENGTHKSVPFSIIK